ncbi:MAG: PTS ascorbate transporter subunit IIC [Oscillospiraceae bacterium]
MPESKKPDKAEKPEKTDKKQVPLRLSAKLYSELMEWAEDDFRSVNGQIEYLLTECVKYRKKHGRKDT